MEYFKLIICVYACDKIDKYIQEIRAINNTYGKLCNNNNIKILYFLGEVQTEEFTGPSYINLKGVLDDYLSASYKQFKGLEYIYENYNFDYVMCIGTDTYINIPKLLKYIDTFSSDKCLYIGGHGCNRTIYNKSYYFHSGGPGIIITKKCLSKLYPILPNIMSNWIYICNNISKKELISACDVAISYYLQENNFDVEIIKTEDLSFIHCNYLGYPCHINQIDITKIITCHLMSINDFNVFTKILESNNYFI